MEARAQTNVASLCFEVSTMYVYVSVYAARSHSVVFLFLHPARSFRRPLLSNDNEHTACLARHARRKLLDSDLVFGVPVYGSARVTHQTVCMQGLCVNESCLVRWGLLVPLYYLVVYVFCVRSQYISRILGEISAGHGQ